MENDEIDEEDESVGSVKENLNEEDELTEQLETEQGKESRVKFGKTSRHASINDAKDKTFRLKKNPNTSDTKSNMGSLSTESDTLLRAMSKMYNANARTEKEDLE